ncbi:MULTISPECIES: hypothetical protein [unclassified Microcoleus]|nr:MULTISPECIES: hypothetical protein [unclassified Microcoleus]
MSSFFSIQFLPSKAIARPGCCQLQVLIAHAVGVTIEDLVKILAN